MATDEAGSQFAVKLFNQAAPGYDTIAQILSYGQYLRWQRALIEAAIQHGIDAQSTVLDAATGTAGVARQLARTTNCRILGLDQSPGMLRAGQHKLAVAHAVLLGRIQLVQGSALQLPFPDNSFDVVLFTYLFRYVDPALAMREFVRVARPGSLIGFIEFHIPSPPWRQLWNLHTRVVLPITGWIISRGWHQVGRFLGPSIERFYATWSIPKLYNLLEEVGLRDVEHRLMSLGGGLVMWGVKGKD
jgi:demethylmenaquinone methyltransferase/2-methoxy-6-polyprenyl-1,4-benzoquinol methylase